MIIKNTKIIFEGESGRKSDALQGGIPLSKGEIVKIHEGKKTVEYEVKDKLIDCFLEGVDQTINVTYVLKRR